MAVKERDLTHSFRGSTRVAYGKYLPEKRIIEVEFVDGVHWQFLECSMQTWQNFVKSPSAGRFIHDILNRHPNGSS